MRPSRVAGWLGMLLVLSVSTRATAQDMTFSVEETGQPPAPPAEGPPSEYLANALRLYQQEKYQEAAVQFQRVVEGETQDAPANVQKAQFFLGKCLYHLRFYQSALAVFDEIGQQGAAHTYFNQTLQWLAQLASQLPEPAGIIEKVGRYGVDQLEQFNNSESADLYNQLLYLMGRFKYSQGEFDEAIALFQRVAANSRWYVQARFFEGITHVRERHAQPAIAAFRAIISSVESGDVQGVEDQERMVDLAWISLARVYYTAANRVNPDTNERTIDGRLLGNAVEAWNRVPTDSEYWLDALFEESWAFFLADEYSRALGNVHTLYSPYFETSYYPEALVLKAVVFFSNCQLDNADAMVQIFHDRFDPVRSELDTTLAQFQDNQAFYEFLQRVRAGQANLSPRIRGIVTSALSDRTLLRNLEYVRVLDQEDQRLTAAPAAFANSSLGVRIRQDIAIAKAFAVDQTGDLARARYSRLVEELTDLLGQADRVSIEVLSARRDQLSQEMQDQMLESARSGGGNVEVDEEHQVWPFNGEYWRDELPFYRQQVTNRCGR
ncbi:MAG: tetratricopeptide repeat protein [Sandaracinaceae bacterium]|nr:tetratricopeptide repeat protein [Sandaracinaceae bacterium]